MKIEETKTSLTIDHILLNFSKMVSNLTNICANSWGQKTFQSKSPRN